MSLGFSVEALLPHGRSGTSLRMGLKRIADNEWLQPNPNTEARRTALAEHPQAVRLENTAHPAIAELAQCLGAPDDLNALATSIWEDVCILTQEADQERPVLSAGALLFPTDWELSEKMGHPLTAIHRPIHGYAEQLAEGVDHFMATLEAGPIFARTNMFVVASDNLRYLPGDEPDQRFGHVSEENAGETLFVRCERQTLRRLPQTRAIIFTIGVYVEALSALSDSAVAYVAKAQSALGEGEGDRRAAPAYSGALETYAAQRGSVIRQVA